MTRDETKRIIQVMVATYPNYKPNDLSNTVDVWHMMLEEYQYNEIALALKAYIKSDNSGFAPSIGQLIDKLHSITAVEALNDMEAWSMVEKAIRKSTYYALEEYAKLPETVQKAVGSHEQLKTWAMSENLNMEVAKSNFMKCYKQEVEREKELAKMSPDVRRLIESVNKGSAKYEIEKKRQNAINALNNAISIDVIQEKNCFPEHIKGKINALFSD